ncbi:hypothetical protein NEOLI_000640 [Neolecta irregularis DAH-3]|uniref:Uncharacterized protein n=1 Tax=Neolecta irregularis (strain DAH-3) TaxID=1198029 RepID=A0A1U7LU12_NEOID|nr:hypothetical protein NEOLI_000640 [Neolecta irregularis DAH-3]|eukprot:OLL26134.1 hypothetical protein NEOLI_000640 [Neolecta irregularis DAH-3]
MRLILIPLNASRSFLYCQIQKLETQSSLLDRASAKAARFWDSWSTSEVAWKKKVTRTGQNLLDRIDFEEYSLKAIPSSLLKVKDPIPLLHPSFSEPTPIFLALDSRRPLHIKWLCIWLAAMPLTLPLALVPVIPNLPGFYATYRAWSHYKAIDGLKTLKFLQEQHKLVHEKSVELDRIYGPENQRPSNWQLNHHQMNDLARQFEAPGLIMGLQQALKQINEKSLKS